MTEPMKESVWFIIVYFFTVGSANFLCFLLGGIDSVCLPGGNMTKI